MEAGDKMKELNMTADEMDRLAKALKDEKFREMLRDYAQEISDPDNRRRYEEEIRLLEQDRGNTVEFIHPKPFKALRTSVNDKQKCFINICANEKVGKPTSKQGVSEEGRRGQCWSLPHSLHPGRQDTDAKGNKIVIYDVIFHPDTLYIASKNKRFMDLVDSTAIQGIQSAFNVRLDKNNMIEMKTKYKGTPQPCIIRKPIPGYKAREPAEKSDPLAFPYPQDTRSTTLSQTNPTESSATKISRDANFQIQPLKTKEPTKPKHTVKYRSFIEIQDFRCSRNSGQSPRPREIVVTIDVPLLKKVTDANLEVEERRLLLESKKPAYRLELPLAYPVDEDKGEAKFNKQKGQITVTLPVLPSNKAFTLTAGPAQTSSGDAEMQAEAEGAGKGQEGEGLGGPEVEEEDGEQHAQVGKGEEEEEEKGEEQGWEESFSVEEEMKEQRQKNDGHGEDCSATGFQCDAVQASPETGSRLVTITAAQSCVENEGKVNVKPKIKTSDIKEETETTRETPGGSLKVQPDVASSIPADAQSHNKGETSAKDDAVESSRGASGNMVKCSGEQVEEREDIDEDDLPTEQIFHHPERGSKHPPVVLREVDKDGNETIISDHTTSAGFIFQNTLMFELD